MSTKSEKNTIMVFVHRQESADLVDQELGESLKSRNLLGPNEHCTPAEIWSRALTWFSILEVHPEAEKKWRLMRPMGKKPYFEDSFGKVECDFSISHTGKVTACAVSEGRILGLDIESQDIDVDPDILESECLSWEEKLSLGDSKGLSRKKKILRLWTLKEAYLKAVGMGLVLDLRKVSFGNDLTLRKESTNEEFNFSSFNLNESLIGAIAVAGLNKVELRIKYITSAEIKFKRKF